MIWLVVGLVLACSLFVLLNWWANAEVKSARKGLFWAVIVVCLLLTALLLGVGRTYMAAVPMLFAGWRFLGAARFLSGIAGKAKTFSSNSHNHTSTMTRAEALDVLGLEDGCSNADINSAYRRLIAQCHPDKGGSDWMAAKLTEARKILLGK